MRFLRAHEPELELLKTAIRPTDVVVDIGANFGSYTVQMSRLASKVLSFEPNPDCAAKLREANLGNVRVHQVALSDHQGVGTLTVPSSKSREESTRGTLGVGITGRSLKVEIKTLDSFELTECNFIKIDVEGHELEVLNGARETLARCRPMVLLESSVNSDPPGNPYAVIKFFENQGYGGFLSILPDQIPLSDFDTSIHQNVVNRARRGLYGNMFFFEPTMNHKDKPET